MRAKDNALRSVIAAFGLAMVVAAAGCSKSNEDKLLGTWKLDSAQTLESGEMSDKERQAAQMFLDQMSMTMTFNGDGTIDTEVAVMGQQKSDSGEWEAVSEEGDVVTVAFAQKDGESKNLEIEFLDGDTISLSPPGMGNQVVLVRQ